MIPTVAALLLAIFVTVAYLALTEHLDYASVRRRQLDAWASVAALGCMGLILYGNASVRHRQARHEVDQSPVPVAATADVPVHRLTPVAPGVAPSGSEAPAVQVVVVPSGAEGGAPEVVAAAPPEAGVRVVAPPQATTLAAVGAAETPAAAAATATLTSLELATVAPTATTVVGAGGVVPLPTPVRTQAPTARPPTQAPPPLPTATPDCGDPADIDVDILNMSTSRRSSGGDLIVDYSFDLRNNSGFPVTLTGITVTVGRTQGGSEQFARQFLDNVTIEAGASYPVERHITLERRPPPVGNVSLCVQYVAETCGQRRDPQQGGSQCQTVQGF